MKSKTLLSLVISIPLILTGCGGGDDSTPKKAETAGKTTYESEEFSIYAPQDWEVIEKNTFTSNVPEETVVVFRNNIINEIFTANVNIGQTPLAENVSSTDLGKSNLAIAKNNLLGFREISGKDKEITHGESVLNAYSSEFEGKKSATEPTIHFKQLSLVNNNIGYTLTGSYLPVEDESVVNNIDEMLDSFSLK